MGDFNVSVGSNSDLKWAKKYGLVNINIKRGEIT